MCLKQFNFIDEYKIVTEDSQGAAGSQDACSYQKIREKEDVPRICSNLHILGTCIPSENMTLQNIPYRVSQRCVPYQADLLKG